jgi:hypothetical protein
MANEYTTVTTHHDGHGVTERILIEVTDVHDEVPYRYRFYYDGLETGLLEFKRGDGPGVLSVAVLAAVIDQLKAYGKGPLASRENSLAITNLEQGMMWLRARADDRARRNVLGTTKS